MAKKTLIKPTLWLLPDTPVTNMKDAALTDYVNMTPYFKGFSIDDTIDPQDATTSANEGYKSYLAGLRDFSLTVMFNGGDTDKDYAILNAIVGKQSLFIITQGTAFDATAPTHPELSAENYAWVLLGVIFTLPIAGEIGVIQAFDVTVQPGADAAGITFTKLAADITGASAGQLGYEHAPVA